jgi:hypothetical protein
MSEAQREWLASYDPVTGSRTCDQPKMSKLRDLVIEAHGGYSRWKAFRTIEAEMSITGMVWVRKGWPDVLKSVRVTADTQTQQLSYRPFTGESLRSLYRPDEVAIESSDSVKVKSRKSPRSAFEGHKAETGWDDLHLAYFSGYAMWNYLNTPFLFLLPDITTEELTPVEENGERRRRLKVTFSPTVATQPLLWWHRIVPTHKVVMGWKMSKRKHRNVLRYTINRVLLAIPTLLGVAILVFFMLRIVPGDIVEVKLRGDGGAVSQWEPTRGGSMHKCEPAP